MPSLLIVSSLLYSIKLDTCACYLVKRHTSLGIAAIFVNTSVNSGICIAIFDVGLWMLIYLMTLKLQIANA